MRKTHKFAVPGVYTVSVKVTNPVTDDPVMKSREVRVEYPVKRDDYYLETNVITNHNGSEYSINVID